MKGIAAGVMIPLIATGIGSPTATAAEGSGAATHFVVDVSGSMGGTPLDQAKAALREVGGALPGGSIVGLRSFGGNCGDGGDLLIPVGPLESTKFGAAVDGLRAGGGTPTPDALRAAVADLPLTGQRQIVLISDGQSGCGDPCETAEQLHDQAGVDFTVHTVGYNVGAQASSELTCIADVTGGTYHDVTDGAGLADVLDDVAVLDPCPDYAVFGLRGSGQTADQFGGFGYEVAIAKLRLERALNERGISASYTAVDYASEGMDTLVGDWLSPSIKWSKGKGLTVEQTTDYADSMWSGSERLIDAVNEYHDSCAEADEKPGEIVMIGYSQGAAAVNWASRLLSADQKQRSTLVLIGDPLRHPGDDENNVRVLVGSANPSMGLLQLPQTRLNTTFTPQPEELAAHTVSLCDAGDLVCDTKDALIGNSVLRMADVHTSYSAEDLALAGLMAYSVASSQ